MKPRQVAAKLGVPVAQMGLESCSRWLQTRILDRRWLEEATNVKLEAREVRHVGKHMLRCSGAYEILSRVN